MVLTDRLGEIVEFSLIAPFRDKAVLKYFVILTAVLFVLNYILNFFTISAFSGAMSAVSSSSAILAMLGFVTLLVVIVVIAYFVTLVFEYLALKKALETKGIKARKLCAGSYARYFLVYVASAVAAIFSIYRLKYLLIGIIGAVLFVVGIVVAAAGLAVPIMAIIGILLVLLAVLLLCIYFIVVFINAIRLTLSPASFIANESMSVMAAVKDSWQRTGGNAFNVFIVLLVVGILFAIITAILSAPASLYGFVFSISQVVANAAGANTTTGVASIMPSYMADPAFNILSIPAYFGTALRAIGMSFCIAIIYATLGNEQKTKTSSLATTSAAEFEGKTKRVSSKSKPKVKKKVWK